MHMKRLPFEYIITLSYIIIGALWILFSDGLLFGVVRDPIRFQTLSTYKGWFFILVTGFLLFLLIKREIRRRNIIYNQLLEANKKAVEADKLKSAFLSNISHYIRTPMNSILGFIELLENKQTSPEKHQDFLKFINDRSDLLLQTLNSIIEISKIQEGQYKINITNFNLKDLLNDIILFAQFEIKQKNKNITIKTFFEHQNGFELYSDKRIILQVLSNLILNSIGFTNKNEIYIGCKVEDQIIMFFVKDFGPGISLEKQKSLFNEFMYNSSFTYNEGEGAGIGLHLSYKLAQLIGARLWLENSGVNGTTFCLSIRRVNTIQYVI